MCHSFVIWTSDLSMGFCTSNVTPLHTHWSNVTCTITFPNDGPFIAECKFQESYSLRRVDYLGSSVAPPGSSKMWREVSGHKFSFQFLEQFTSYWRSFGMNEATQLDAFLNIISIFEGMTDLWGKWKVLSPRSCVHVTSWNVKGGSCGIITQVSWQDGCC